MCSDTAFQVENSLPNPSEQWCSCLLTAALLLWLPVFGSLESLSLGTLQLHRVM